MKHFKTLSQVKDEIAQEAEFADWLNIENSDLEQHEIDQWHSALLNGVALRYAKYLAKAYAWWLANQVIAGRDYNRLWNHSKYFLYIVKTFKEICRRRRVRVIPVNIFLSELAK